MVLVVSGVILIAAAGGHAGRAFPLLTEVKGEIAVCQPTVIGSTSSFHANPNYAVVTMTSERATIDSATTRGVAGFTFFVTPGRYAFQFKVSGNPQKITRVVNIKAGAVVFEKFGSYVCSR